MFLSEGFCSCPAAAPVKESKSFNDLSKYVKLSRKEPPPAFRVGTGRRANAAFLISSASLVDPKYSVPVVIVECVDEEELYLNLDPFLIAASVSVEFCVHLSGHEGILGAYSDPLLHSSMAFDYSLVDVQVVKSSSNSIPLLLQTPSRIHRLLREILSNPFIKDKFFLLSIVSEADGSCRILFYTKIPVIDEEAIELVVQHFRKKALSLIPRVASELALRRLALFRESKMKVLRQLATLEESRANSNSMRLKSILGNLPRVVVVPVSPTLKAKAKKKSNQEQHISSVPIVPIVSSSSSSQAKSPRVLSLINPKDLEEVDLYS